MSKNKFSLYFIFFLFSFFYWGCSPKLKVIHDLSSKNYILFNQDSNKVNFPKDFEGKVVVIGFIYTTCPDICPLTTNNIKNIKQELDKKNIKDVEYIDISFDPKRDTPTILNTYAKMHGINTQNFQFLTGNKNVIDSLLKNVNVFVMPGDSTIVGNDTTYFYVHTDRISIMDKEGKIKADFQGSTANKDEVINTINKLR